MSNVQLWPADWDQPFTLAGRSIDPAARSIECDGKTMSVEPRVMALLIALAREAEAVQRRDQLIDAIWPNSPGADTSLSNAMSLLRRALRDDSRDRRLIETVPKVGYRLVATPERVREISQTVGATATAQPATRTRSRWILPISALAIAAVAVWLWSGEPSSVEPSTTTQRVAVLPILNDNDTASLAGTLADELRDVLAEADGLVVLDGPASARVADALVDTDVRLEADIARDDEQLVGRLRLYRDDAQVSDEKVTATADDELAFRQAVLNAAVTLFDDAGSPLTFAGNSNDRVLLAPTQDLEAYRLYAVGQTEFARFTTQGMTAGISAVEQAVARDPAFVDAWIALGDMYAFAGSHMGFLPPSEASERTREALLRAVTLAPNDAEAQASLGDHYTCVARDLDTAGVAFERALELDPASRHSGLIRYWMLTGERDRAFGLIDLLLNDNPDSYRVVAMAGNQLMSYGAAERARRAAARLAELAPGWDEAALLEAKALAQLGRVDEAVALLQPYSISGRASPRLKLTFAALLGRAGQSADAQAMIDEVKRSGRRYAESHMAIALAWLGDTDAAFDWLQRAADEREFGLCYLAFEPLWAPLRQDPRFAALLRSLYPDA